MNLFLKQHEQTIVHLLLGLGIIAYGLYFSVYQIHFHQAQWTGLDTTNMEQTIWNTLNGNFMRATTYPSSGRVITDFTDRITESRLADHVQPLQLILLIPYTLIPRIETLTTIMSFAVALGAIPLFEIAQRRLRSNWLALAFALIYLLLPGIQTNTGWEIHGTHFLPPLMLAALNAAEKHKRGWAWLWALLAMGCREDIPFLMGWAFFWLAPTSLRRDKLAMLVLGTSLSLINFLIIIPAFSGGAGTPYLVRFFPPDIEMTLPSIVAVLQDPAYWAQQSSHLLAYAILLGLPVLFLCFAHWQSVTAMLPLLLLNGLAWTQTARLPFFSHYSSPIIVWTIVGGIYGVAILSSQLAKRRPLIHWPELITTAALTSVIAVNAIQGYLPHSQSFAWPTPIRSQETLLSVLRHIPADASVSSSMHLAPRLAQRETIHIFPDIREVDWIVLDFWFWGDPYGTGYQTWQEIATNPQWETVIQQDGLLLLKKGNGPPTTPFNALQLVLEPPQTNIEVVFSGSEQHILLRHITILPLPYNIFILCTDWEGQTQPGSVLVSIENGEWQLLNSLAFLSPLSGETSQFRDCTQLGTEVATKHSNIRLMIEDINRVTLLPSINDTGQWFSQVGFDGYLHLEIPIK